MIPLVVQDMFPALRKSILRKIQLEASFAGFPVFQGSFLIFLKPFLCLSLPFPSRGDLQVLGAARSLGTCQASLGLEGTFLMGLAEGSSTKQDRDQPVLCWAGLGYTGLAGVSLHRGRLQGLPAQWQAGVFNNRSTAPIS